MRIAASWILVSVVVVDAAEIVERQGAGPLALVDEIEFHLVLARRKRFSTLPLEPLQIQHDPEPHRLAVVQIEAVAPEAAARAGTVI